MRIAYLILAHDQPSLFGRLVHALTAPGATIFAHIDGKTAIEPFAQAGRDCQLAFIQNRIRVHWGGYSQVEAMLRLLQEAHSSGPHDYYILLSGRDYPIRGNGALRSFLSEAHGKSFMNFYAVTPNANLSRNISHYAFYDLYANLGKGVTTEAVKWLVGKANAVASPRKFPEGVVPYRGSTSWCLSGVIVEHLLQFVADARSRRFISYFKSVACPDETFFQTVVLNSPLAATLQNYAEDVVNLGSRVVTDENKVNLHYIDWNPLRENPAILVEADLPAILESGKSFARKFDESASARLLDVIDEYRDADVGGSREPVSRA